MTPFARAYALALRDADPTRDMNDCLSEAARRENVRQLLAAEKASAKRSAAQKRAWRKRKAKLAASVSKTA
tara:strand:- start:219 stop:431 length:213 start_codon:yes stop_codon:yes gene_type:complete